MKKFVSFFMLAMVVFALPSCTKDEEEKNEPTQKTETPANTEIVGHYTGWTQADAAYFQGMIYDESDLLDITVNDKKAIQLVFNSNNWGTATFEALTVTKNSTDFVVSGQGVISMSSHGSQPKDYDCSVSGTISLDKQTFTLVIDVPTVMGGLKLTIKNGTAPSENKIAGSFTGWTQADATYFQGLVYDDVDTLTILANEDGTVKLVYSSHTWGKAIVDSVALAGAAAGYTMSGNGVITMTSRGTTADYPCSLSGTISNDKNTYLFTIDIPDVMGGTKLTFQQGVAPAAKLIAGRYMGWSSASSQYFQNMNNNNDTVTIAANADGTVNVAYRSSTWGKGTFNNVPVSRGSDGFLFAETSGSILMANHGVENTYDAVLSSAVISFAKNTYTFTISVPDVMAGTTLVFQQGEAPQDE